MVSPDVQERKSLILGCVFWLKHGGREPSTPFHFFHPLLGHFPQKQESSYLLKQINMEEEINLLLGWSWTIFVPS